MSVTVGDLAVDLRLATATDATLPVAQSRHSDKVVGDRGGAGIRAGGLRSRIAARPGGGRQSRRFLYDKPSSPAGNRYSNAWASFGGELRSLSRYVTRRARVIGGPTAAAATEPREPAPNRPMPATPAEAAGGISTTIRSWTAALIRHAIDARVARIEQRLDALEGS